AQWWGAATFEELADQTQLRLDLYDLPPIGSATVDGEGVVESIRSFAEARDPELFLVQARRFLDGPHILERLLDHLMQLRAIEAPNFITVAKGLTDELRGLLEDERSPIKIEKVKHSHVELWASVQGSTIAFIDGGVARYDGFPGIDQFALRVGTYLVTPGDPDPDTREVWDMCPRVLADVVNMQDSIDRPDPKRLQEAIRYVLEALVLMESLESEGAPRYAYLHGPLINQFVTYDEGTPYFLPKVLPEFLQDFGLDEVGIRSVVQDIPRDAEGHVMWDGFMAVYAAIIKRILESPVPAVGVVERTVSSVLLRTVFDVLVNRRVTSDAVAKKFKGLAKRYDVTDALLFGCLLKQGEYLTPVTIKKNPVNRAHDRWQPVVRQYGNPTATMLKPHDGTYPIRLELNQAAYSQADSVVNLTYHTARLLPRYAFPAGLDIVDKYVKIPDWMSRAVGRAGAAALMRRAIEESDDPRVLAQVRRVLAGQPRDFFYRPTAV
ncbi:MAG: DNA double-strand break repair nuclease NurA, partial [Acidimicrobiales bacterium]